ncbi:hypothetical protein [Flavobacterium sp.]|uniref:hypothetical protein n=1 Tax=Flavobacterium sp. TaxID=239 RepID=UPI003752A814
MKKTLLIALILFVNSLIFGQENENTNSKNSRFFTQFDVSIPFKGNPNRNETYVNSQENTNKNWFVPDGINAKIGYGIQENRWIGLSLHTGIDWKATEKLVAIPIFANLGLSTSVGNNLRLTSQVGYGKGFALGRGNLSGAYKKISLGIETDADLILFAELSNYDIKVKNFESVSSFSLGIALRTF